MNVNNVDIIVILDRSGSMESIRNDMIGGLNNFVAEQKGLTAEGKNVKFTLVQFDDKYETIYNRTNINDVAERNRDNYVPRGSTALHDAIGRTLNNLGTIYANLPESERPGRVVCLVCTDGFENASKEFSQYQVASMVKHQTDKYNWQFVYIGANQDAVAVGTQMSFTNNVNFIADTKSSAKMWALNTNKVRSYGATGQSISYSDEEQKDILS